MITFTVDETADMLLVSKKSITKLMDAGFLTGTGGNDITYDSLGALLERYKDFEYVEALRGCLASGDFVYHTRLARLKGCWDAVEVVHRRCSVDIEKEEFMETMKETLAIRP